MDLDFRQLMNLLSIARSGSFSLAAQARRVSQPALSSSIAQLEARTGGRLFDRGRNGASLTELGAVIARHAEIIEAQMQRASEEIEHRRQHALGPLSLAVTPVAFAHVVPRAIAQFKAEFPDAAVHIQETVFAEAMRDLLRGTIDLSLGPFGVYPAVEGVIEERLSQDTFRIIARAGNPILRSKRQSLKSLRDAQWVLPSDRSAYRTQLEALFIVSGVSWPAQAVLTNSIVAVKAIVLQSDCIAIMPQELVRLEVKAGMLDQIALKEAGATRALGLSRAAARPLSPLAERFAAILRTQAGLSSSARSA
jgi:LysR family transcriptional regulator of gallate degradation